MPLHRSLNKDRIIHKLTYEILNRRTPLRDYVTFSSGTDIIHLPSNHKNYQKDTEEYIAANLLQATDLLLGATIRSCYHGIAPHQKLPKIGEECDKQDVISYSVKEMLDKYKRHRGFTNSGHFKSFTISEVNFSKDSENFKEVHPLELPILDKDSMQLSLFHRTVPNTACSG